MTASLALALAHNCLSQIKKAANGDAVIKAQLKMDYDGWRPFWAAIDPNNDGTTGKKELADYLVMRYKQQRAVRDLSRLGKTC